jgi:hypothetical protein
LDEEKILKALRKVKEYQDRRKNEIEEEEKEFTPENAIGS